MTTVESSVESHRAKAREHFAALLPINRRADEFKHTPLEGFSFEKFGSDMASKLVAIREVGDKYHGAKVIRLSSSSSEIETTGDFELDGITVMPWADFEKSHPEVFAKIAPVPVKLALDPFAQWTAAHAMHGLVIMVAAGKKVSQPLQIIHRLDSSLMAHRVCVWLGEGSSCSVLEEYRAGKSGESAEVVPAQVASLVQGYAQPGSHLEWNQVQALPDSVSAVMRTEIVAARGSQIKGSVVSLGAKVAHYHLDFVAQGEGAHLDFVCASLGTKDRQNDFFIRNSHPSKNSTCETRILSVVADEATAVFNGMIEIPKHAPKVDAAHRAKALVLSSKARVQSNPKLEISTDDVKCAHGSSISSIDPAQLYYLQSRGVSRADAESMIVDSFLNPALDRIPVDGVRSHYKALVSKLRLVPVDLGVLEEGN